MGPRILSLSRVRSGTVLIATGSDDILVKLFAISSFFIYDYSRPRIINESGRDRSLLCSVRLEIHQNLIFILYPLQLPLFCKTNWVI